MSFGNRTTNQGEITVLSQRTMLPLGAVACVAALTLSGPAASQPAPRPTSSPAAAPSAGDRADELYRKGLTAAAAKDWPEAFRALWEAYQLKKSFDIAGNLGTAELRLGKYPAAATHLAQSLTLFPVNGSADAKKKTEELLEEAKKQVGTLRFQVTPKDALVKIGDRRLDAAEPRDAVFVEPGEMRVDIGGLMGFTGVSRSVKVAKGQVVDVTVALAQDAAPTASASGAPTTPPIATADPLRKPLIVTGVALTAAGLAAGIGVLVGGVVQKGEADGLRDDLLQGGKTACANGTNPDCAKFANLAASASTLTNTGASLLIGGGLVGIATAVYAVVSRPRTEHATSTAAPPRMGVSVGPQGASLSFTGSF